MKANIVSYGGQYRMKANIVSYGGQNEGKYSQLWRTE